MISGRDSFLTVEALIQPPNLYLAWVDMAVSRQDVSFSQGLWVKGSWAGSGHRGLWLAQLQSSILPTS